LSAEVVERGVDTWRLARYLDADRDVDRMRTLCPQGLLPARVAGHRVGFMPGHRMVWIEGHPAVEGLADPESLAELHGRLLEQLETAGVPLGRDAGIGRADATVTLGPFAGREGHAVLAGAAALDVPRMKPMVVGKPPQTVYWQGERSKKVNSRVYDKGLEGGFAAPGEFLRFEDQRRFTKETRRSVSELEPAQDFARRFAAMARSAEGIRATSLPTLSRELAERVNGGEMTHREAERLVGHLVLEHAGAQRIPERTMQRRRRELRDRGLVLADDFFEPVSVDLGETFDAALCAWDAP
jgi:hypothetical protein